MKLKQLGLTLAVMLAGAGGALAQGTAFTYQGRLDDGVDPANGTYDLTFTLYDLASGGTQQGIIITNSPKAISNGLFTVTLDFGNQFSGANRWLEIGVRTNGGSAFNLLSPRQFLSATPYAVTAGNVSGQINGSLIAPGSVPDASLSTNVARRAGGNAFVGNQTVASGKVGVGIASPTASFQVGYTNVGVGVFVGDRTPFGTAAVETDLSVPTTHAWFAENGTNNVFHVKAGGDGFFAGNLGVGTNTPSGKLHVVGDTFLSGQINAAGNFNLSGDINATGILNLNTPGYAGVTVFIRARPGDNLPLAVQGTNGVNFLLVSTNAVNITGALNVNSGGYPDVSAIMRARPGDQYPFIVQGTNGVNFLLVSTNGNTTVSGEIFAKAITLTGGADLAEPFQMSDSETPKGSVVAIDEANPGHLRLSTRAYDTRVAGVVSGANGVNPGLSLSQKGVLEGGQHVALTGRVYVRADATYGPIRAGDLLTTSETPGHAMRVADHTKAPGAVLGKAMSNLEEGQGFVLVLVSLQ